LLTPQNLYDYERQVIIHQLQHPDSMLWLGMSLGKTVITLTTIVDLIKAGKIQKVLIFAPVRVIHSVWERESRKWSHTDHLRFSIMEGTPEKRTRALFRDADIYLCSYGNMNWLAKTLDEYFIDQGKPLPFQFCVYDEISKVKNSTTRRIAGGIRDKKDKRGGTHKINVIGWRKHIDNFLYRTGLTGTPASNGYIDLHGQYLVIDGGARLDPYVTHFRDSYFIKSFTGWTYTPTDIGKQLIESKIHDITIKMDTRDYLDLPDVIESNIIVELPPKARKHYEEVEKEMFTVLDSGAEIELFSKHTISNKLLQMCNGHPYINQKEGFKGGYDQIHTVKFDALEDVLEEAAGQPVLCSYSFRSDAAEIMKRFKKYSPVNLTETKPIKTPKIIDDWNEGKIRLLVGHPASMGHGIDGLQYGGSIVTWFGMNWSLELYQQMNQRIDRQGQTKPVQIIRILCRDTVDLAVVDAINRKDDDQAGLKASLARYRRGDISSDNPVNFF